MENKNTSKRSQFNFVLNAIIDTGSEASFISEYAASILGLKTKERIKPNRRCKNSTKLDLVRDNTLKYTLEAVIIERAEQYTKCKMSRKFDLIIGASDYDNMVSTGMIPGTSLESSYKTKMIIKLK